MGDEDDDDDGGFDDSPSPGAPSKGEILLFSLRFLEEFREQEVPAVTVRQMYYRFVAKGLLVKPKHLLGEKAKKWWNQQYKRIGKTLSDARYRDEFPLDGIRDGGRHVHPGDFTRDIERRELSEFVEEGLQIQRAVPSFLVRRARWHGQPIHLSVWVEKEGMESIFSDVCTPDGVGLLACKGYPSVSALYEWLKRAYFAIHGEHPYEEHALKERRKYTYGNGFDWTEFHRGTAQKAVVLYFGDHDPDGFEIPRSSERGLRTLMDSYGLHVPLEFQRIALNRDQVEQYEAPSFEAKKTSARYKSYKLEHETDEAWELDALDPVVLRNLIRDNIARFFRRSILDRNMSQIKEYRATVRGAMEERLSAGILRDVEDDDLEDLDDDGEEPEPEE